MPVVVFGSLNVDTTFDVPRQPAWGETVLARGMSVVPGGKGANQAVAARRMGAEVRMVGRVGNDAGANVLRESLSRVGVDHSLIQAVPDMPTGTAFILRTEAGENAIVVSPGANAVAAARDLVEVQDDPSEVVLLLQLEVPAQEVIIAAEYGHRQGWHVLLNAAPAEGMPRGLLGLVNTLVVNEIEAGQLSGVPVADPASAVVAARLLGAGRDRMVAVTLGALGAVLVSGHAWLAEPPPVSSIDATGAGDAFVGALAVGILERQRPNALLRLAVAAASLSVASLGAQPSMPARRDVELVLPHVACAAVARDSAEPPPARVAMTPTRRASRIG